MRGLNRNKSKFYYATYISKTALTDAGGMKTGEFTVNYSHPIEIRANTSTPDGEATANLFGTHLDYNKVINPCPSDCPIDENSILWVDTMPTIITTGLRTGETDTPHDYTVTKKAPSKTSGIAYAIKKVR